jgi:hypothetical protein
MSVTDNFTMSSYLVIIERFYFDHIRGLNYVLEVDS